MKVIKLLSREMQLAVSKLQSAELTAILEVQSAVLREVQTYMAEKGVLQLLPVMISPFTDPLNHSTMDGEISYYDEKLQITKSMILHKQLSLIGKRDSVYIVSPNVRLETMEKAATGRHLIEFSQVDFELKGKSAREAMCFTEELFVRIFSKVKGECKEALELLGRDLKMPHAPFPVHDSRDLERALGADWEKIISERSADP
ncbi:MAG: amino acid--tRNA ligase-related protein, partial [Candidatus Micrarchaeota archaeon]